MVSTSLNELVDETSRLSRAVIERCRQEGLTLATAESLTAGLCAASLASVPGASNVLRGGLVVYATDLKHSLADVNAELLSQQGPIDPDVAELLASGAAQRCTADVGIGLTGVAGPDPQDGHPVGEVYVGWSVRGLASAQRMPRPPFLEHASSTTGDPTEAGISHQRAMIRQLAVNFALSGLLERLKG